MLTTQSHIIQPSFVPVLQRGRPQSKTVEQPERVEQAAHPSAPAQVEPVAEASGVDARAGVRERRILELYDLVRMIARHMSARLPGHVDLDDLISAGTIGLIDAVDRYDDSRGASLRTFAASRIRGAMTDSLRRSDWVPRTVRQRATELAHARHGLTQRLSRQPEPPEVAEALGISLAAYQRAHSNAAILDLVSLEAPLAADRSTPLSDLIAQDGPSVEELLLAREHARSTHLALDQLPPRVRATVTLHYLQGLTQREIGVRLGLSESRVSQLSSSGVRRLRELLTEAAA